jgi:adenine-specific DNA-methyltransferase
MTSNNDQFSELTIEITKKISKEEKKNFGIFITPKIIILKLFTSLIEYINSSNINIKRILEPSCGSCEIIYHLDKLFNNVEIFGVEFNEKIFHCIKDLKFENNVKLINNDFIKYTDSNYDLIVGNPPYFVCKKTDIPKEYQHLCNGRPNIFGLFILHSLNMLNDNGILAFVIPRSFLNSMYYSAIRNLIKKMCKIIDVIDFKKDNQFIDTDQATFGLIIQKLKQPNLHVSECTFSIRLNDNFIFTSSSNDLKQLFEGSTTLEKLGLKVRTGNIVWNEHKDELTDDNEETLLIYNTNISKDNQLEVKKFNNEEKGQYIKKDGRIDPTMVVNRGNGNSVYKLNYAVITKGPYLIENHLNEIYSPKKMEKNKLLELYEIIKNSFKNPKTKLFIEQFLGNNGLSKTELETIFPIYYEI